MWQKAIVINPEYPCTKGKVLWVNPAKRKQCTRCPHLRHDPDHLEKHSKEKIAKGLIGTNILPDSLGNGGWMHLYKLELYPEFSQNPPMMTSEEGRDYLRSK